MNSNLTEPIHRTTCRVLYGDTDAGGVVYYANYLRFFEIGRTEFMRDWVCSYRDIEGMGLILPVAECYTRYKAPAFYDDLLIIETSLSELTELSCRFSYKISREQENSAKPKLLVKGYTVNASINREGKLTSLPEDILAKLRQYV